MINAVRGLAVTEGQAKPTEGMDSARRRSPSKRVAALCLPRYMASGAINHEKPVTSLECYFECCFLFKCV